MGKPEKVRMNDGPGTRARTVLATPAEEDAGFPTVKAPSEVPEAYGFGTKSANDQEAGADGEQQDLARPDGFATIRGALAAERAAADATTTPESAAHEHLTAGQDLEDVTEPTTAAVAEAGSESTGEDEGGADDDTAASLDTGLLSPVDRDALLAHLSAGVPEAVSNLVTGNTVPEILASVKAATEVHDRVANSIRAVAPVSGGGTARGSIGPDVTKMTPVQKIAYGIQQARVG